MKKTSNRVLKTVCVLALIGIVLWVAFYAVQSYFVLTTGSGKGVINWGSPNIGSKLALFIVNRLFILLMAGLMAAPERGNDIQPCQCGALVDNGDSIAHSFVHQ